MVKATRIGNDKEFDREVAIAILEILEKTLKPMCYDDITELLNRKSDLTFRLPSKIFILGSNAKTSYVAEIAEYLKSQNFIREERGQGKEFFGFNTSNKPIFCITDTGKEILLRKGDMPFPIKISEPPKR